MQAIPAYMNDTRVRAPDCCSAGFKLIQKPPSRITKNPTKDPVFLTNTSVWTLKFELRQSNTVSDTTLMQKQGQVQLIFSIFATSGTALGLWRLAFMWLEAPILALTVFLSKCWNRQRRGPALSLGEVELQGLKEQTNASIIECPNEPAGTKDVALEEMKRAIMQEMKKEMQNEIQEMKREMQNNVSL